MGHGWPGMRAARQEDRKKSDQSSRSEKRKISRCSFPLSLPLSLPPPPSSIRTSSPSSLNSGRQRVIYCGERERERERVCNGHPPGGLRYSSGSSYFAAPQPRCRRPELRLRTYNIAAGVINGTHLAPIPEPQTTEHNTEREGREGKIGRIDQPQNGRKGSVLSDSPFSFPGDCFRVAPRGEIPLIGKPQPNLSRRVVVAAAIAPYVWHRQRPTADEFSPSETVILIRGSVNSCGISHPNHGRAL